MEGSANASFEAGWDGGDLLTAWYWNSMINSDARQEDFETITDTQPFNSDGTTTVPYPTPITPTFHGGLQEFTAESQAVMTEPSNTREPCPTTPTLRAPKRRAIQITDEAVSFGFDSSELQHASLQGHHVILDTQVLPL
jgi:hypothetical protein